MAEEAGDSWAAFAYTAAVKLSSGQARGDESIRVRLLADLRRVFEEQDATRLPTSVILEMLCKDETAPWGDWHGRPLTPHALGRLLKPFGISAERWREGNDNPRGYSLESCVDAFARWLPSESVQMAQANTDAMFGPNSEVVHTEAVPLSESDGNPLPVHVVPLVPDSRPPGEAEEAPSLTDQQIDAAFVQVARKVFYRDIEEETKPSGSSSVNGQQVDALVQQARELFGAEVVKVRKGDGRNDG